MSALTISRLFKPSVCKKFLRHTNVRLFSSSTTSILDSDDHKTRPFSSTPAYPFLLIDYILDNQDYPSDGRVSVKTYNDSIKRKEVLIKDRPLMEEVYQAMTVGFSRDGVGFTINYNEDDTDSPVISYNHTDHKLDMRVYLPPLPTDSKIQSLAMSSLPIRDKNWVVGVKLSGSQVCICRPFGSNEWINIKSMSQSLNPLSSLMFSKTDRRFYIPSFGGNLLCYFEPERDEDFQTNFVELKFDHLPNSASRLLEDVSSCSRTDHLVESPTGQLFLVKWYGEDSEYVDEDGVSTTLKHITKDFMVFRAGGSSYENTMIYTEDIGDLCIFVGRNEAFCVPASSSPGLKPNCIYFVGYNFGVYDLTTKSCTIFADEDENPLRKSGFPYWPSPARIN